MVMDCLFICLQQSMDNFNKSNLTLCPVMNQWNLRGASALQHRWRSNLIAWNCQLMTVFPTKWLCHVMVNFSIGKKHKMSRKQREKVNQVKIWQTWQGEMMHCALVTLHGEMLIRGDIIGVGRDAAQFDSNIAWGDISGRGRQHALSIGRGKQAICSANGSTEKSYSSSRQI